MTPDRWDDSRLTLSYAMLNSLPKFGQWADTVREFETAHGTIGYRQAAILWAMRYELLPPHEMTPTGFAKLHHVQPSVITRALAKLEHAGFVERTINPHDTRVSHISITAQGTAISQSIEQLYLDDLRYALEAVSDEEIATLQQSVVTLNQIADKLDLLRRGRTRRSSTDWNDQ